jgi:SAM-dependent methyltransferase
MTSRSSSAPQGVSTTDKLRENAALLGMHVARLWRGSDAARMVDSVDRYRSIWEAHSSKPFEDLKVLEVGFGARPLRMRVLQAMGIDATGVDLERPLTRLSIRAVREIARQHGLERAAKSLVRHALFDTVEDRDLRRILRGRGATHPIDESRLLVMDASAAEFAPATFDLVVSEDVFEHIEPESIKRLVPKMRRWLRPDGLAIIQPNIFTGITGGHLAEWYQHNVLAGPRRRQSAPWEHLRQRRFVANTYLNELSRADFRSVFASEFEILDEQVRTPELGRGYLTPEIAAELAQWSDDELFSNAVSFTLRPRLAGAN